MTSQNNQKQPKRKVHRPQTGHTSGTGNRQPRNTPEPARHGSDRASVASTHRRLLSIAQASQYMSLSSWTVREMIWRGDIPHLRCGRRILIDLYDLDAWIELQKVRDV